MRSRHFPAAGDRPCAAEPAGRSPRSPAGSAFGEALGAVDVVGMALLASALVIAAGGGGIDGAARR